MRKITTVVLALGLIGVFVAGCGPTSEKSVASKLETHAQNLDATNYKSVATMTVQMGDSAQSYYVETWYDSPNQYRIALGDANKNIHQIIVHNANGMFVVSPSLGKVFRFNGNWAQNQGHIYLYDQTLQQIASAKDVKMSKSGSDYSFEMPVQPASDVVVRQRVQMDAKTFKPQTVTLLDKDSHAVVTLTYKSFDTNVSFKNEDFNPESLISQGKPTKATMSTEGDSSVGYIDADGKAIGSTLSTVLEKSKTDTMLRYSGEHGFTLEEFRPGSGVDGLPNSSSVVDLYGVPAIYTGDAAHQLIWMNNGVEFALTSNNLTLDQMKSVALSTFGQVGK
jgi:outer membrane lipoprotein-sorting protein